MKHRFVSLLAVLGMILVACANQEISAATHPLSTPDPCATENIEPSIKQVNDLTREFTDAYQLASNVAKEQVPSIISNMQRIRRAAEDQKVPDCLLKLKTHQLAHMNTLIDVMLAFVSGADLNSLTDGLSQAQSEYDLYTNEIASLLGLGATATPVP